MSLRFKPRILVLPLAALVIAGLVLYKANQKSEEPSAEVRAAVSRRRAAPTFALHDQASQPFKLSRYLGRHKLLIVFFDSANGTPGNRQLQILAAGFKQLSVHGEKVIAISNATPWANRQAFKAGEEFPFHVLSDADQSVAGQWGSLTTEEPPKIIPSAFVVDRAGIINWSQVGGPSPIPLSTFLRELANAR